MDIRKAYRAVEQRGILLVFPIKNAREPRSLWSEFFPRTPMRWEWEEDGDGRVVDLWHLRARLATSQKVIYTKWYKGRATLFSRDSFRNMLSALHPLSTPLTPTARVLLDILEDNSPLSTKALKKAAELQGRDFESTYTRALKELWERLLIVGFGEVDDGAFPSLAIGATRLLFEDLWRESLSLDATITRKELLQKLGAQNPFFKFYDRLERHALQSIR